MTRRRWVLILVVVVCAAQALSAAERVVLCEEFTSQFCHSCAYAGPALSRLLDTYDDTFVLVQYHLADAYMLPWSTQRWNDYGDPLTPDGRIQRHRPGVWCRGRQRSAIHDLSHQPLPSQPRAAH
jgi:hypothetical protein